MYSLQVRTGGIIFKKSKTSEKKKNKDLLGHDLTNGNV